MQGARTVIDIGACFGALRVRLLLARMPGSKLPVYVIDAPYLYRRGGSPYQDSRGRASGPTTCSASPCWAGWPRTWRPATPTRDWAPDIVHAHDWHAAMACAYMAEHPPTQRRPSVFTVHNLAYQGLFPMHDWPLLGLASRLMSPAGLEFHGQLSFMKAGLKFADRVTTVSPTYAREIATHEFGCGLDGVIRGRGADVTGILNGIDDAVWNPATDPAIAARYDAERLAGKQRCRQARCRPSWAWTSTTHALLLTVVSRLTAQKGLDLVLAALPAAAARRACSSRCRARASRRWRRRSAWRSRRTRAACTCTSATTRRGRTG